MFAHKEHVSVFQHNSYNSKQLWGLGHIFLNNAFINLIFGMFRQLWSLSIAYKCVHTFHILYEGLKEVNFDPTLLTIA